MLHSEGANISAPSPFHIGHQVHSTSVSGVLVPRDARRGFYLSFVLALVMESKARASTSTSERCSIMRDCTQGRIVWVSRVSERVALARRTRRAPLDRISSPADANMMEDLETSPSSSHMYPRLEVSYNPA